MAEVSLKDYFLERRVTDMQNGDGGVPKGRKGGGGAMVIGLTQ